MYNSNFTGEQIENLLTGVNSRHAVPFAFGGTVDVSNVIVDNTGNLQEAVVVDYDPTLGVATLRLHMADSATSRKYGVRVGSATATVELYASDSWNSFVYETNIFVTVKAAFSSGVYTLSVDSKYYITAES